MEEDLSHPRYKAYRELSWKLQEEGLRGYMQRQDQMVVSEQEGAVSPFGGNSFFLTHLDDTWYLGTWGPRLYRVGTSRLVELCVAFARRSQIAMPAVPADIIDDFELVQLAEDRDEAKRVWDHAVPEDEE